MTASDNAGRILSPALARQLEHALDGLEYGSIQLVVHEARIVRLERVERIRLTGSPEALSMSGRPPTPTREVRRHVVAED